MRAPDTALPRLVAAREADDVVAPTLLRAGAMAELTTHRRAFEVADGARSDGL